MPAIRQLWTPAGPTTPEPAADWRQHGACRNEDPELFFPIGTTDPALLQVEEAKAVCARCPVMEQCRRWALETRQEYGVWGGLTERERRAIWRRNAETGCGTEYGWRSHNARKETPCDPCQAAHDKHIEAQRREALAVEHAKGGTRTGARIHHRLGEPPCGKCSQAAAIRKLEEDRAKRAHISAENTARNAEIVRRRLAGESPDALAVVYDLSSSYIRQLVRAHRESLEAAA